MRKSLLAVVLLSIILILPACAGKSKTTVNVEKSSVESPKDSSTVVQKQKEPTVSLAEIDGWNKVEGSVAIKQYLKDGCSVIVTRDIMPVEANTPDKFIEFIKGKSSKTFNNVKFGDSAEIAGLDSAKHFLAYTYDFKVGETAMKMKVWVTYIIKDGSAYALTCAGLADSFSRVEDDFKTFIESFKVETK